ncbi:MAG: glycosyltransferase [Bacteroidales bacterium]|nr:glycosyltransferase [Bacteroidales bacterium]
MEQIYFSFDNIEAVGWIAVAVAICAAVWLLRFYRARVLSVAEAADASEPEGPLPPVSVIITSSGNVAALEKVLEDAAAQKYPAKVELVVVNDGKSGDIADVVTRFGLRYPDREIYYTHVPDEARNLSRRKLCISLGIKACRYDYVVLTSSECTPVSDRWLSLMISPIAAGKEVSLGFGYIAGLRGAMNRFDEVATATTWLSEAIKGNPYRGCSFNLAYRKQLFFDAKGFARTLVLHYGDDDLFINQITDRYNTAVVLSHDALVSANFDKPSAQFRELRLRHCFTARMLHGDAAARWFFRFSNIMLWIWLAATVAGAILTLPNALPSCILLLIVPALWIPVVMAWRRTGAALGVRLGAAFLPFMIMFRWIRTVLWSVICGMSSRKNHTWRN